MNKGFLVISYLLTGMSMLSTGYMLGGLKRKNHEFNSSTTTGTLFQSNSVKNWPSFYHKYKAPEGYLYDSLEIIETPGVDTIANFTNRNWDVKSGPEHDTVYTKDLKYKHFFGGLRVSPGLVLVSTDPHWELSHGNFDDRGIIDSCIFNQDTIRIKRHLSL